MVFAATTPIVTNPVLIFFIVLAIILLAPVLLNKLKIPHIVGMIVAGVVIGPYGFNILAHDMSFELFGQVGILYLMFLAGIEIDMYHLKINLKRGMLFGLLTFFVPLLIGTVASVCVLKMDLLTSVLLASMYASHTLIAYPVAARFGITKSPAVLIAIVGTIIAVIGALLVLAVAVNIHNTGYFDFSNLIRLFIKLGIYCIVVLYSYPRITRRFFKSFNDNVTQYVFVLALVFLSAWLAQVIGLEAVLGAFFAGLVLNRYVPNASPLMNRITFVGNALFIPYFLIGVGMMINIKVIANFDTIFIAANMIIIAIVCKWLAAYFAQKTYKMTGADRGVLFGLTTAHTAVALAVVTIGYNLILPDGSRMMNESVLNGTILMILVTCIIAPIVTSKSAANVKMRMLSDEVIKDEPARMSMENILIPVSNPITAQSLVDFAILMRKADTQNNIYALHVRNDNSASSRAIGRNALDVAAQAAASVDVEIETIERYDLSTITGLLNTIEERDITNVVLGMHRKMTVIDSFFGSKIEQLLKSTTKMVVITRCFIPVNTITRIVVAVPPKAQYETGFRQWVMSVANLARQIGCRIIFCCPPEIKPLIRGVLHRERYEIRSEYHEVKDWDDFVLLANMVLDDDLFIVVSARANSVSYNSDMVEVPGFLQKYFARNNLVVLYPEQFGQEETIVSFFDPMSADINTTPSPLWLKIYAWYRKLIQMKKRITHRNRTKKIDI